MTLVHYFGRWAFVGACSVVTLTHNTHLSAFSIACFTGAFFGATMNGAPWGQAQKDGQKA